MFSFDLNTTTLFLINYNQLLKHIEKPDNLYFSLEQQNIIVLQTYHYIETIYSHFVVIVATFIYELRSNIKELFILCIRAASFTRKGKLRRSTERKQMGLQGLQSGYRIEGF